MAQVIFKRGLLAGLPTAISDGTIYVTTDERAMYIDIDGARVRLGDFQEFDTLAELQANANPSTTALYYVKDVNCLAKYDAGKKAYIQINLDTGATSVEVVGDGNAVTTASYDPATRKLTLTKGETFAKAEEIGALGGKDKVAETDLDDELKAKVNASAEGNHSHANKDVLDGIDAEDIAAWNTVEDKAEQADLEAVEGKVDTLIGDDTGKSARTISTEEATKAINDFATKVSDDGVVNSFKELVDWAAAHGSDAAEMAAAIQAIQAVLAGIGGAGEKATVIAYVTDAIDALKIGDYAKAADLTALAARVTDLEADTHTHANKALLDTYTQTEAALADAVEKVHEHDNAEELAKIADGDKAKWDAAEAKAHEHDNKTVLDGVTAEKVTAWDAAEKNAKNYTDTALTWGTF